MRTEKNLILRTMACISACKIEEIIPKYSKVIEVTGLIIAKTDLKTFDTKSNLTFTLRDSKHHFINCTIWGASNYVQSTNAVCKLGSIVRIVKPIVKQKESNSMYTPKTTSPYQLTVNDGTQSYIYREPMDSHTNLVALKNETIKSTRLSASLDDIINSIADDKSKKLWVDTVALVIAIEPMREIQTKFGQRFLRKLTLSDQNQTTMQLVFWNSDLSKWADEWQPLQTILHLVDVRAEYSSYAGTTILTADNRTIIIKNPVHSSRANELREFVQHFDHTDFELLVNTNAETAIDVSQINNVCSIRKILEQINSGDDNFAADFTALLYGVITKFEVDNCYGQNPIVRCCVVCQKFLRNNATQCDNARCIEALPSNQAFTEKFYISMSLSDHSGTLNCRIGDEYATKLLNYSAEEYKRLPEATIDIIQKKFQFERVAAKILVKRRHQASVLIKVLDISFEDPNEIARKINLF